MIGRVLRSLFSAFAIRMQAAISVETARANAICLCRKDAVPPARKVKALPDASAWLCSTGSGPRAAGAS